MTKITSRLVLETRLAAATKPTVGLLKSSTLKLDENHKRASAPLGIIKAYALHLDIKGLTETSDSNVMHVLNNSHQLHKSHLSFSAQPRPINVLKSGGGGGGGGISGSQSQGLFFFFFF